MICQLVASIRIDSIQLTYGYTFIDSLHCIEFLEYCCSVANIVKLLLVLYIVL